MQEKDINLHVVYVQTFIRKGNTFLMAKRASDDPQAGGDWSIPGGKVDMDKQLHVVEDTLKREIKEEVDLEVKKKCKYIMSEGFTRSAGQHVVGLTFLTEYKSGVAKPLEDQEKVKWMTIEEIRTLIDKNPGSKFLTPILDKLEENL